MSDRNKARVSEFLDRVLTGGDIEATGDYFEATWWMRCPSQDRVRDSMVSRKRWSAFDLRFRIRTGLSKNRSRGGDKVLSRFVWSGTHQGEFLGIPATHRPIRVCFGDRLRARR